MSEPKFQMSINLQVLNHLGLNLYSNTSERTAEVFFQKLLQTLGMPMQKKYIFPSIVIA